MKSFFKFLSLFVILFVLMVIQRGLNEYSNNKKQEEIKNNKENKIEQVHEVKPDSKNNIVIKKGKNKVILSFKNKKDKPPTSINVNSVIKDDKINITSNGSLKSSPFEWSVEDDQKDLKDMLNSKLNIELSYGNDKIEKNYNIIYK